MVSEPTPKAEVSSADVAKALYESERRTILDGVLFGIDIDPHVVERHLPVWENLAEHARLQKALHVQCSFLGPLEEAGYEISRKDSLTTEAE